MADAVNELIKLISSSASALSAIAIPLDKPQTPEQLGPPPHGVRTDHENALTRLQVVPDAVFDALSTLKAATAQLNDLIQPASVTVFEQAMSCHTTNALRIAIFANVAEQLRDSPQGTHVDELAKLSGMSSHVLLRCLRLLATRNIFIEVSPGVFKTNKLGSVLDNGKSIDLIRKDDKKAIWTGASAAASVIAHTVDEVFPWAGESATVDISDLSQRTSSMASRKTRRTTIRARSALRCDASAA